MDHEIKKNLVFLVENITSVSKILLYLIQHDIITENESEQIKAEKTTEEKNAKLLSTIQKKDWNGIKTLFLEILRKTSNQRCADKIEGISSSRVTHNLTHLKIAKWWPDKKLLIKSLHKRRHGDRLFVQELHERISKDDRRMVALCECLDAAKLTGMGGVGKTVTATWYAHTYETEYDHILWIDCGEDSLLKSFKKLASDLDVSVKKEFEEVEEFARKCFESLSGFKCLWIYDNAENYQGKDGIMKVLPKYQENFYCLITSRSRQWGFKNGYGEISLFELHIFGDDESLEFLKGNLKKEINYTEYQLKQLGRLLGNLPLALQLAVAALNNKKIDLQNYIEKTSVEDVENIVNVQFDAYEKTINKSVKMSLDLIVKENGGNEVLKVVMTFGYIRPDQVPSKLLQAILKLKPEILQEAICLLNKYCLIDRTKHLLSIHRLLQQVIRHNGRKTERETLRRILSCTGFLDYKLLPFTKYADEDLKRQFPKVKAELLDQKQLKKLIKEKRFDECVQLSKFIHQELKRNTTKLNYAICLYENGDVEECVKTAEELSAMIPLTGLENNYSKAMNKMVAYLKTINLRVHVQENNDVVDVLKKKNERMLLRILLFSYLRLGKFDDAVAIGRRIEHDEEIFAVLTEVAREKRFEDAVHLAKLIHQEINTKTTKWNYAICLFKNGQLEECLTVVEPMFVERYNYEIEKCVEELLKCPHKMAVLTHIEDDYGRLIDLAKEATNADVRTVLLCCHHRLGNHQTAFKVAKQIVEANKLMRIMALTQVPNYHLRVRYNDVHLEFDVKTKKIELIGCSLSLSSFDGLCPEELTLEQVSFCRDGRKLEHVTVNGLVDLTNTRRLKLRCGKDNKNVSVDLAGDVAMEYLDLEHVPVRNFNISNWSVKELKLTSYSFVDKTNIKVQELTISNSSCDVSCLPRTIQKLTLKQTEVFMSGGVELSSLKYLTLGRMDDVDLLSHFCSAPLTHIHLHWITEVNVDLLPQTLPHLRITNGFSRLVGGVRKVDKLILEHFSFEQVEECLTHVQTDNLVTRYYPIQPKELTQLMEKEIKSIAVGRIDWDDEEFKNYSLLLDRQANFYLLQGGKGRAMEQEQFKNHLELSELTLDEFKESELSVLSTQLNLLKLIKCINFT